MVLTAIHSGYLLKGHLAWKAERTEMYSVVGPEDAPDWKTSWGYGVLRQFLHAKRGCNPDGSTAKWKD